jgi:methionyl-tRNA formyltransferase
LMVAVLGDLAGHPPVPQPEDGVTYAAKIDKAEARIDFARSAVEVERLVRAMNPAPGAWFEIGGERVKVLAAEVVGATPALGHPGHSASLPGGSSGLSGESETPAARDPSFRWGDGGCAGESGDDGIDFAPGTALDDALTIACGSGAIRPTLVQRAGRGVTSADDLLRGFPIPVGTQL